MDISSKLIQDKEHIVSSLFNLRNELATREDATAKEIVFKINSCLFSEYPHHRGNPRTHR